MPPGVQLLYHSESGVLNCGPLANDADGNIDLINAGGQFLQAVDGMSFFDSAEAFAMIRGGHIDMTVLGALQVSAKGDLANWFLPSRGVGNVGGAMDLAVGAKHFIVAMEHSDRSGRSKIVSECTFPLTARRCVRLIVTDVAVFDVTLTSADGLRLIEVAPGWDASTIGAITAADFTVSDELKEFELL